MVVVVTDDDDDHAWVTTTCDVHIQIASGGVYSQRQTPF